MTAVLLVALLVAPPAASVLVEPPPLAAIDTSATASAPAERVDPPPSTAEAETTKPIGMPAGSSKSAGGRCVGWEPLLAAVSPGWSVERMSRIAYRESRCQTGARNRSSTATGLLQILGSHCPWIAARLDDWCTRARLADPVFNLTASAALWREQGYGAWSTS